MFALAVSTSPFLADAAVCSAHMINYQICTCINLTYIYSFCSQLNHFLMSHYNTMYSVMALDTLLHFFQELDSLPWGHHTVALVSQIALANLFLCIYYFMFIFFCEQTLFLLFQYSKFADPTCSTQRRLCHKEIYRLL